jgi:hypothetical protein
MNTLIVSKDELQTVMNELVALGEDRGEMNMWYALYNLMTESEQQALRENLENELRELKKISQ